MRLLPFPQTLPPSPLHLPLPSAGEQLCCHPVGTVFSYSFDQSFRHFIASFLVLQNVFELRSCVDIFTDIKCSFPHTSSHRHFAASSLNICHSQVIGHVTDICIFPLINLNWLQSGLECEREGYVFVVVLLATFHIFVVHSCHGLNFPATCFFHTVFKKGLMRLCHVHLPLLFIISYHVMWGWKAGSQLTTSGKVCHGSHLRVVQKTRSRILAFTFRNRNNF